MVQPQLNGTVVAEEVLLLEKIDAEKNNQDLVMHYSMFVIVPTVILVDGTQVRNFTRTCW
jgi:hypothetical protein